MCLPFSKSFASPTAASDGGRGLRADALDLGDALAGGQLAEHGLDAPVEVADPPVQLPEELEQARQHVAGHGRQAVARVGDDPRYRGPGARRRLAEGDAAVEQDAPHLADQGRPVVHQALPAAVQGLDVLLRDRLERHEAHAGPLHGLADRLGVVAVVLVAADEGLHELRADDPHHVPGPLELPRPVEGARAGFDADRAARQRRDEGQELIAPQTLAEHRPPGRVHPVQLEQVLRQVDAQHLDLHGPPPC
jgi:hypothetical protein